MDLMFSDVLAVMKHLAFIQFPPFPEKGLGRDRIADLYNAQKVLSLRGSDSLVRLFLLLSCYRSFILCSLCIP